MSSFKTVLVRDSVIGDVTDDIDYAVKSGAAQSTYQSFPTTSASNSALIFNIQCPSENVIIGRDVLINTGLTATINVGSQTVVAKQVPVGELAWEYGATDAFHAFPLQSLFSTATAQINNTTVSINTQDVLPTLLRMNNSRELYRYNSTTPALPDQAYGSYANTFSGGTVVGGALVPTVPANNSPLASFSTASYDLDQVPRGAFPITYTVRRFAAGVFVDNSLICVNATDTWEIVVSTVVSEPIFLSPFIFGDPCYNQQGFLGINNMTFTFNIDSTCKRLWSSANPYITSIGLGSAANPDGFNYSAQAIGGPIVQVAPSNPSMLFKFLSSQPSDLIATKNIVPYMDFPRYLTSSANASAVVAGATTQLTSSNLQINQMPDLFAITIRKPMATQTSADADAFFKVNNISINLNNQSGLLSSATAYDLWRISVRNGSTQSWGEFSGQQSVRGVNTPTTGSLILLSPAYDLSLPDYISCGSLGNYNFQFQVGVTNQFGETITPEICAICVNSGIMTTQQGVSSIYTGILTKEMVLDAKSKQQASAVKSAEVKRMVGGALWNMPLSNILGKAKKALGIARDAKDVYDAGKGLLGMGGATSGGAKKYC
jgi:hypothetical protein